MSTINAAVTEGKKWSLDANNKWQLTMEGVNQAAKPSVQITLDDGVATADIKEDAVTAVKLADAVADEFVTACTFTLGTSPVARSSAISASCQFKDGKAENATRKIGGLYWFSTASAAVDDAPDQTDTASVGTKILEATASVLGAFETDVNGVVTFSFQENTSIKELFLRVMVGNYIFTTSTSLHWSS